MLKFDAEPGGPPRDFELYVNGVQADYCGPYRTELPCPVGGGHGFTLPPDVLYAGDNVLELMSQSPWSVHWAEIAIT